MALNTVPQANQAISATQTPILQNFATINTAFAVDHVPYTDASGNQGKHAAVTMPVQAADKVTLADEIAMYTKLDGNNVPQIYYRQPNNGTVFQYTPMGAIDNSGNPLAGYSTLAGNLLLKWGTVFNVPSGASGTLIDLNATGDGCPYTVLNSVCVQATMVQPNNVYGTSNIVSAKGNLLNSTPFAGNQMRVYSNTANTTIYWLAICTI